MKCWDNKKAINLNYNFLFGVILIPPSRVLESVTEGDLNTSDYKLPEFSSKEFPERVKLISLLCFPMIFCIAFSHPFLTALILLGCFHQSLWGKVAWGKKNSPGFLNFLWSALGLFLKIRFGYNWQKFKIIILFLFHVKTIWR